VGALSRRIRDERRGKSTIKKVEVRRVEKEGKLEKQMLSKTGGLGDHRSRENET